MKKRIIGLKTGIVCFIIGLMIAPLQAQDSGGRYLLDYFRGEFIYGFPFLSGEPQALHIHSGLSMQLGWRAIFSQPLAQRRLFLSAGVGVSLLRYNWRDEAVYLQQESDRTLLRSVSALGIAPASARRSRLDNMGLTFPVMLSVYPFLKREYSFGFTFGVITQYRIHSSTYNRFFIEETTRRDKHVSNYAIRPWHIDIEGRISYASVSFYYRRGLNPLFYQGSGPADDLRTHSFGIIITSLPFFYE